MRITLSISENQGSLSNLDTTRTIEQGAITIGRGADNDWVLPDPERIISNRHCTIQYRDGEYFITDTSTNGVFVNDSEDRIERGESLKLHDRDHLSLGNYELLVRIEPSAEFDSGGVTAAGLVTDVIFTPDLNAGRSDERVASAPHLNESVAMAEDALQTAEHADDSREDLDTEKPKSESAKQEEYLGVTEFDWPIDKKVVSASASSEPEIPDLAEPETAEEDLLKVDDSPQSVAHQDNEDIDESEDMDDSQAHGATTSELEELFGVDEDQLISGAALQENLSEEDASAVPPLEEMEISKKPQTPQNDVEQGKFDQVADVSEYEPMGSEEKMTLQKPSSAAEDTDLPKSLEAPSKFGEASSDSDGIIPEDWWREEGVQVNESSASSVDLPLQHTAFLLETRLAEHFQQQQKHFDLSINKFYRYLQPYYWGFETLRLDKDALARGEIALASARGLMPDGTFFDMPTEDELPEPLPLAPDIRQTRVVLRPFDDHETLRERQQSSNQFARSASLKINSNLSAQTRRLTLRLQLDNEASIDKSGIAIARIREVRPDQQIVLDETYVPPALDCHRMPILNNHIKEVQDLLQDCGNRLALELDAKSDENRDVVPLLLLQVINRYDVCFAHLAHAALVHPIDLYQHMSQMVAEIATFVKHQRRPVRLTTYDHSDLASTFASLLKELRQLLPMHRQQAMQLPFRGGGYGIFVAALGNRERHLLESANLILEVHDQGTAKALTDLLPTRMTVGPLEKVAQLVNQKQPGINLNPLSEAPSGMTTQHDAAYFRLDRGCPLWQQLSTSKGLAFHATEELSELDMRLWIIPA